MLTAATVPSDNCFTLSIWASITFQSPVLSVELCCPRICMRGSSSSVTPITSSSAEAAGSSPFLDRFAEDKQSAWYYWVVNLIGDDATHEDYWLRSASAAKRLEIAKQKCAQIDPLLKEILEAAQPQGMIAYIPVLDLVPLAIPKGRVTLLGDAFHPMTIFKGEGGNHAMQDALDLGKMLHEDALARRHLYAEDKASDWVQLLAKYCNQRLPVGKAAVLSSRKIALEHSSGNPRL